jgi:hypothetical protein
MRWVFSEVGTDFLNNIRPILVQLFPFAPLLIALLSPLPNALPSLQPTFTGKTSEHCLGTFTAGKFLLSSLNVVFLTTLPQRSLFLHFSIFKGLI